MQPTTLGTVDPRTPIFRAHAHHNAWANHRLLGACAQLDADEFAARRTSFFPSIKATLNHILTVDWYYIDAMERTLAGRDPNPDFAAFYDPEEPFSDCAALRDAQRASDARLIALCDSLDDSRGDTPGETSRLDTVILVPRRTGIHPEPLPRLLFHLYHHQVHHRGQVHAMLAGTRIAPPQLDEFFCVGDGPVRADDFEALGFDERVTWLTPAATPARSGRE